MKRVLVLIIAALATFTFTACNKEVSENSDTFTQYTNNPLNDTAWLTTFTSTAAINDMFDLLVPGGILVDSFNIAAGGTVHFGDSLDATFPPNSCISNSTVTPAGNGIVQILQLRTKGDYIKFFKPTTAANGSLLQAGGGIYMRVTKDDKELVLAPNASVKVRFATDSIRSDMQAFYGKETNPLPLKWIDTSFLWQRDADTTHLVTWTKPTGNYQGYEINAKNLRWIAAEKYVDSTQTKTKLTTILAPNYTNKNTAVFAVFVNQKTVVNLHADYPSRSFYANNIPVGSAVTLISLSKIGDDLYLGIENVSSVTAASVHKINPQKKTLRDILTYLNTL